MPLKTPDARRQYGRTWMAKRRAAWIAEHGPCQRCGSSDDLQIDHIDPRDKSKPVAALWGYSEQRRNEELAKCQVLCRPCHREKTAREARARLAKWAHGTREQYRRGCRCATCTASAAAHRWGRFSRQPTQSATHGVQLNIFATTR